MHPHSCTIDQNKTRPMQASHQDDHLSNENGGTMTRKHALSQVLKKTHAKNLDAYRRLLTRQQLTEQSEEHGHQLANTTTAAAIASANFWDIVVVTAGDSQQRLVYEHQIDYKLAQGSIPTFAKYHVVDDPVGSRVGSGGSTFLVMKFLQDKYPQSVLSEARVLLIHAGGYSTRLPHVSARGKVFTTLPQADAPQGIEVLDLKFVLYMHLLKDMPPGVFLTSADGVELFSSKTRFPSQSKPLTITALAHPSSTHIGSTHGVYLLQDSEGLIEQDAKLAPNQQSAMLLKCKRFLHKPSLDVMRTTPSVIHAEDDSGGAVYTDSCYFFDPQTAAVMANLSSKLHPESDLEAWADILSFQDPIPSNSTLPVSTLLSPHQQGRQLVREAFQSSGIDLDVMVLNASKFYHLGTMQEFLDAACIDVAFMSELNIRHCGAATQTRDSDGIAYVDASLAQSAQDQLVATAEENGVIHSPVYLENSFVPVTATVHAHSILVDCTLPAGAVIPKNTCMFTLRLQDDEFVTFTFSIKDDMKKEGRVGSNGAAIMEGGSEGASLTTVSEELMVFESVPVSVMRGGNVPETTTHSCISHSLLLPSPPPLRCDETQLSLWTAPLFEVARTRQDSILLALRRLDRIRQHMESKEAVAGINTQVDTNKQVQLSVIQTVGWTSLKVAAKRAREY